ncbi:MAG: hypothetical protein ACW97G_14020 [Candidatus Thorarchaeota archaeon]
MNLITLLRDTSQSEHFDRFACGRCGYTEFKRKSK